MPKKKRLLKKDLDEYKKRLLELRQETAEEVKHISNELKKSYAEASGDVSSHAFHPADEAAGSFERDFSLNIASAEKTTLRLIDSALHKIEENTDYGICESCEKPIPKRRLNALPYVRYCMKCQEEFDAEER
jgi:DnaK suppressor protein